MHPPDPETAHCDTLQNATVIVTPTAFAERGGYDVVAVFKETASGASSNRAARIRVVVM